MAADWFRKKTWTPDDAADFEARLRRSRSSRPQYLYIQALSVLEIEGPTYIRAALQLADRAAAEPAIGIHISSVHRLRGQCFERLGDVDAALDAYRAAVQCEVEGRVIGTDAYLDFAWLVAARGLCDVYEEAARLLGAFAERAAFPAQGFQRHAVLAVIADERGDRRVAVAEASAALAAAVATGSGFRYHRRLGLVGTKFDDVQSRLRAIVAKPR